MTAADRILVAVTGVYLMFAGWQLHTAGDFAGIDLAAVWPYWFAAAGVACVVFAAAPHPNLLAVSGALAVTACAGRSLAILLLISRAGASPARGPLAAATWAALAVLLAVLWLRVLRPLVGRR